MRTEEKEVVARAVLTVGPLDCATQWGNDGLEVLSTPAILGNMERICAAAMDTYLDSGEMTVGVNATMHHRAPVPVDAKVEYLVKAVGIGRKTEFSFEVRDAAGGLVCDGTHLRAVIDLAAFHERLGQLRDKALIAGGL